MVDQGGVPVRPGRRARAVRPARRHRRRGCRLRRRLDLPWPAGRRRAPSWPPGRSTPARSSPPARAGCSRPTDRSGPTGRATAARARHERLRRRAAPAVRHRPRATSEIGFNYRMTDIQAAVGLVQLGQARRDRRPAARRSPTRYQRAARRRAGPAASVADPAGRDHQLPVVLAVLADGFPLVRDELLACLAEHGVSARAGSWPPTSSRPTPARDHGPCR